MIVHGTVYSTHTHANCFILKVKVELHKREQTTDQSVVFFCVLYVTDYRFKYEKKNSINKYHHIIYRFILFSKASCLLLLFDFHIPEESLLYILLLLFRVLIQEVTFVHFFLNI